MTNSTDDGILHISSFFPGQDNRRTASSLCPAQMIAGPPNTRPRIWIDDVPEPKRGDPGVGRSDERTDALTLFFPSSFPISINHNHQPEPGSGRVSRPVWHHRMMVDLGASWPAIPAVEERTRDPHDGFVCARHAGYIRSQVSWISRHFGCANV